MDGDDARRVLEVLLTGNKDVLRYLWMSYTDPMACPLEKLRWHGQPCVHEEWHEQEAIRLMINAKRW